MFLIDSDEPIAMSNFFQFNKKDFFQLAAMDQALQYQVFTILLLSGFTFVTQFREA